MPGCLFVGQSVCLSGWICVCVFACLRAGSCPFLCFSDCYACVFVRLFVCLHDSPFVVCVLFFVGLFGLLIV